MAKKKTIACRVCGKDFEPCAYCQSHSDVFRWRNFACSIECATKYINAATEYRKLQAKNSENKGTDNGEYTSVITPKKKKKSTNVIAVSDEILQNDKTE